MPVPLLGLHDFQEKVATQLVPWSRSIQFWARAIDVYAGYKVCQFRTVLISDAAKQAEMWERQHELAAEKMYSLCSELGGFFLKAAQVLGKPDLAPAAWVRRLVTLCDKAPATPISTVQQIIEEDLGQNFSEIFEQFEVEPIGSASIAQVHRAKLRGVKTDVAVKVQHPGVQQLMLIDIRNLQAFALFLQKTDINFDLYSVTKEVEKQISYEFDFLREAVSMERIKKFFSNNNEKPPVLVPRIIPGMVTRKVLAMEFIDGVPIMNLGEQIAKLGIDPSSKIAVLGKQEKETFLLLDWFPFCMALGKILKSLTLAYGQMILKDGFFHADPHPGNILICKGTEVALLDYGQVKQLPDDLRLGYANLVLALADNDPLKAKISYKELGIDTLSNHANGDDEFLKLAQIMFDTKLPPGVTLMSPFAEDSSLKKVSVQSFPEELFSVLRTMQLLRGLSVGMGIFYSCAEQWRPIAEEALFKAGRLEVRDLKDRRRGLFSRIFQKSSTTFTV